MKALKDWSKSIDGLAEMDVGALENLYSEMLATAHDLKFSVPDALLVETQDPAKLREVIPPLHEELKKFHSELKNKPAEAKAPKPIKVAKETATKAAAKTKAKESTKPAAPAKQKAPEQEKTDMAATAKTAKTAKKAAPKAAKGAKKGGKAAADNARTAVGRSKFTDDQKITVKFKDIPAREGSEVYNRLLNLQKHNGKTVGQFLKSSLGKSSTLANSVRQGWISIK